MSTSAPIPSKHSAQSHSTGVVVDKHKASIQPLWVTPDGTGNDPDGRIIAASHHYQTTAVHINPYLKSVQLGSSLV